MKLRHNDRSTAVMLAALAMSVTVGLAACGSSDAADSTVPVPVTAAATTLPETTVPATVAATTVPATTAAPDTSVADAPPATDNVLIVTDAEVADLEKQLDEIDQLLTGVDSDLNQD
jgi:hypothetical protein